MKIVYVDAHSVNPGDLSWDELSALGELVVYPSSTPGEAVERAKDADMVLTNKVLMREQEMSLLPKLKYIGVMATGYNTVDLEAAAKRGIVVTNIPAYSTNSVAQMTFAQILNITNRIDHYARKNREGGWCDRSDFCYWDTPLHEIAGKTLGIVGLGNIGMKVAKIARDFDMDVFAFTSKNAADLPAGIQKTTFDGLLSVSDILTLHCPLTPTTRGLIDKKAIGKMKPGSILINTGRGPLVNESDVAEALASGRLSGYGADVMCQEPPGKDNPLFKQPNAFITPHVAWATFEARKRLMGICVENVKAFVEGHPINVVNK